MNHRSRCQRAFSTLPLLMLIVIAGISVLAMRSNQTWNGVALGERESQIVAQLGEPMKIFNAGTVTNLQYPEVEIWLRHGRVYCIKMTGEHRALYMETCLRFGLPVGTWGTCTDWHYGDVVARLTGDSLTIVGI